MVRPVVRGAGVVVSTATTCLVVATAAGVVDLRGGLKVFLTQAGDARLPRGPSGGGDGMRDR